MSSCTSVRMRPRSNDKLSRLPIRQKADLFGANILANKISLPRAGPRAWPRAGATLKENTKYPARANTRQIRALTGTPNEKIVQNHLNIALLNVF